MARGGHQKLDPEIPMISKSIPDTAKIPPEVQSGTEVQRPGLSAACIVRNGIRHVLADEAQTLVGCPCPGVVIPYFASQNGRWEPIHDPGAKPYCRLRKEGVQGRGKYHQPAGTRVH